MGDVDEFFLKRKHIDGCKFVVAGVSAGSGIGNKALSIVSALVYAVLTQRVLLVPLVTAVPGVFCEPFEGSSWMVDPHKTWSESKKRKDLWEPLESFYKKVDARRDATTKIPHIYAASTTENWDAQPEPRFFCDTEQAQYTRVEWINFRNNLYFIPKLFAVPTFRPLLEDLFPNRKVFTHLLRTVMLPCDPVWNRVKQTHDAHFRHAHRRVGVQERYFNGKEDFKLLHKAMEDNVVNCLLKHGWLPNRYPKIALPRRKDSPPMTPLKVTTVFITSLYQSMHNRLSDEFVRVALGSGDAVGLVQLTHEGTQSFGVEVDRQALTEILCLSLMDHLILTPQSTFGALAQGYGGLVPWFVDLRPETSTPCVRAQSSETCFQIPATKMFTCPHDVGVNGKLVTEVVPYLSDCHLVEKPFFKVNGADLGLQLTTS
jgi:xyloglucan fucosyltransferase